MSFSCSSFFLPWSFVKPKEEILRGNLVACPDEYRHIIHRSVKIPMLGFVYRFIPSICPTTLLKESTFSSCIPQIPLFSLPHWEKTQMWNVHWKHIDCRLWVRAYPWQRRSSISETTCPMEPTWKREPLQTQMQSECPFRTTSFLKLLAKPASKWGFETPACYTWITSSVLVQGLLVVLDYW